VKCILPTGDYTNLNRPGIRDESGGNSIIAGDGHEADSRRRSARIHAAPAIAKVSAVSLQFVRLWGSERSNGTHTSSPKITSIMVRRRVASSATRFVRRATAASANRTVVVTAQNI